MWVCALKWSRRQPLKLINHKVRDWAIHRGLSCAADLLSQQLRQRKWKGSWNGAIETCSQGIKEVKELKRTNCFEGCSPPPPPDHHTPRAFSLLLEPPTYPKILEGGREVDTLEMVHREQLAAGQKRQLCGKGRREKAWVIWRKPLKCTLLSVKGP